MIRFTLADLERANAAWGCNCGPAALAAICGLTLEEARPHFGMFPGFTNVTAMGRALDSVQRATGRRFSVVTLRSADPGTRALHFPRYGLARIQLEGPWTAAGANPRWAYRHTHWVGTGPMLGQDGAPIVGEVAIWDVNALGAPLHGTGWSPLAWWSSLVVPALTADIKRATGGWHITHAIEVERR